MHPQSTTHPCACGCGQGINHRNKYARGHQNYTRQRPLADRFWEKVRKTPRCWLWTAYALRAGYGVFCTGKHGQADMAHRVSWRLHFGPIPDKMFVCHSCDTPSCVRPDHLFLGTHEQNMADMRSKNRQGFGEHNTQSRLTEDMVRLIRRAYVDGQGAAAISRSFDISYGHVYQIVRRERWAHVTP